MRGRTSSVDTIDESMGGFGKKMIANKKERKRMNTLNLE